MCEPKRRAGREGLSLWLTLLMAGVWCWLFYEVNWRGFSPAWLEAPWFAVLVIYVLRGRIDEWGRSRW